MTTPDSAPAVALEPKTKLSGKVLKTTLAGALVDIGQSLPGVIHISQLQTEAVNKVEDVVKEGQAVDVWVRRVKKDRIELTMIEPLAYEWKEIQPDLIVKGKVVRLETYGAFVDFGAERPGLIHVSELTHGYVKTASEVLGRAQRQQEAALTRKVAVAWDGLWYNVVLTIIPDEYDPHAILTAIDDAGTTVATCRVAAQFSLTRDVANKWAQGGFAPMQRG